LCGRKLQSSGNDTTSEWLLTVVAGNLAAAPERIPKRRSPEAIQSPQRSLFSDRPVSKIIPFESRGAAAAPAPAKTPAAQRKLVERTVAKAATPKAPPAPNRNEMQPELDLMLPPAPITPRRLKTKIEASIYCDATVATLPHRTLAGAVDFTLILVQYAISVTSYFGMGGGMPTNRLGYMAFGAAFVAIAMFYGLIWALGNTETPGMSWAKLRLTNFEGQDPEIGQRLARYFGTCLSVATGGCGLLWALVDEEKLAWQDHMSKTFPTFQRPDTNLCTSR
jgi:uncharacterized RDD family membrane protein YckC